MLRLHPQRTGWMRRLFIALHPREGRRIGCGHHRTQKLFHVMAMAKTNNKKMLLLALNSCKQGPIIIFAPRRVLSSISSKMEAPSSSSLSSSSSTTTTVPTAFIIDDMDGEADKDQQVASSTSKGGGDVHKIITSWRAFSDLAKAKLSALVVSTAAVGFVAAGGPLSCPWTLTSCCVGTALLSSSAAAWNQIIEMDRDVRMKRTQTRPLVQGTITPHQAKVAAMVWGVTGTAILMYGTNPITVTLGVGNVLLYAGLYTYLKPRSIYNTWVGAVVGAVPPLMGWTAAYSISSSITSSFAASADATISTANTILTASTPTTESLLTTTTTSAASTVPTTDWCTSLLSILQQLQEQLLLHQPPLDAAIVLDSSMLSFLPTMLPWEAWWLAGVLYLWQMPHFLALSYMHRVDYRRGGFQMVSTVCPPEMTARLITRYAWYLSAMPLLAAGLLETTSSMFAMEGLLLNGYALRAAYKFQYDQSNANARHVFLTSLWYLPSLLMLYLLHSKVWDNEQNKAGATVTSLNHDNMIQNDSLRNYLADWIHRIRSKGRQVCLHEQAVDANNKSKIDDVITTTHSAQQNDPNNPNENGDDECMVIVSHPNKMLPACPIVVGKHVGHASVEVASHAGKDVVAAATVAAATTTISASSTTTSSSSTRTFDG